MVERGMMNRLPRRFALLVLGLAWLVSGSLARADGWVARGEIGSPTGNVYFTHRWNPRVGLRLKLTSAGDQPGEVEIHLTSAGCELRTTPASNLVPTALRVPPEVDRRALPSEAREVEVAVIFRHDGWSIFLDQRRAADFAAPFLPPATLSQPPTDLPEAGDDDFFFQRVEPFVFSDDFLVPEEEENVLSAWQQVAGQWRLHTAVDSSVERQNIAADAAAGRRPEPGRSPNFYSLTGEGQPAILTTGYDFYDSYSWRAAMQTREGEMGIVFYAQEGGGMHGFTVNFAAGAAEALFQLWRSDTADCERRYILAAAKAPITTGQWITLRVVAAGNRVRCQIDNTQVFDEAVRLPPGGAFGLFANADGPVRFDDARAESHRDLDLRSLVDLRRHLLAIDGALVRNAERKWWRFRRHPVPEMQLVLLDDHPGGRLLLGSPHDDPHWFQADFQPLAGHYTVALIAAYRGPEQPYFRFTYRHAGDRELFTFEKVADKQIQVLDRFQMPAARPVEERVTLACDGTEAGLLKLYRDGKLVMLHPVAEDGGGGSGLWVAPNTKVAVSRLDYRFQRPGVYKNKFEKNRIFATDPFMRHWSSPEGEWIDDREGHVWYKSDFHGRFMVQMPYVANSQIHLSVREGRLDGDLILLVGPEKMVLTQALPASGQPTALASVAVGELELASGVVDQEVTPVKMYALHYEDHWLWLTTGSRVVAQLALEQPLRGRRMRIQGVTTENLMHSYVERYNVQDFLFTESLHEWVLNGGSWEVVNRFQCQPRWSHMNGESADSLAALWSKYRFDGDFCVELYAGMRHGWYDRSGDLNLTVMNRDGTPSQGYTITTTGWDPDHSQLWTKLYRDGKLMTQSDKYLVPRTREGSERRGYTPLEAAGRPVHGAWYYLKLRRVGDLMEFQFDNEPVFSVQDKQPLNHGGLGLWTYMNSMMVARVKFAAENIRPLRIPVRQVPRESQVLLPLPLRTMQFRDQDGLAYPLTVPGLWQVEDEVGRGVLEWWRETDGTPYFTVTNQLAGGQFLAVCGEAAHPYERLAGWLFYLKRTSRAQFNFHFTLGRLQAGQYVPERHYFHRLSGSELEIAGYRQAGATELAAAGDRQPGWHDHGDWLPVVVWLDALPAADLPVGPGWYAKPVGFGNLQPSYVAQGLTGNGPGEAYAVKGMVPIRFGVPKLPPRDRSPLPQGYVLLDATGRGAGTVKTLPEISARLAGFSHPGLNRHSLQVQADEQSQTLPLWWIVPPEQIEMLIDWDRRRGGMLTLLNSADYPDRRFLAATASVAGLPLELLKEDVNRLAAILPRQPTVTAAEPLALTVQVGEGKVVRTLDWQAASVRPPPVLLGLDSPLSLPLLLTFENRQLGAPLTVDPARMQLGHEAAIGGSFLRVGNQGQAGRLLTGFALPVDLARYPLLQFDYRTSHMGNVTLELDGRYRVALGEELFPATAVRFAPAWQRDQQWHTWVGMLPDVISGGGLSRDWFASRNLQIRSAHKVDQTGRYSTLDLDNLVAGPAISTPEQLTVTPDYFDHWGVAAVLHAVYLGATPFRYLDEAAKAALEWRESPPGTPIRLERLPTPDGPAHLLLKARGSGGLESAVTDIPFLVDTRSPLPRHAFVASQEPTSNGTMLTLAFDHAGGAPLDLREFKLKWNDRNVAVDPRFSTFSHAGGSSSFTINWPHLFREQLNQVANGATHNLVVAGLRDGAGNTHPDLVLPLVIDHRADRQGPTWLPASFPENVLWACGWESPVATAVGLAATKDHAVTLVKGFASPVYAETRTRQAELQVWADFDGDKNWLLDKHPYFSFRLRRPGMKAAEKVKIELLVSFNKKELYAYPLTGDGKGSCDVEIGRSFEWTADGWTGGVINLRELLRQTLEREAARAKQEGFDQAHKYRAQAEQQLARQRVRMVGFRITGAPANYMLQLRDLYVFRPWADNDTIAFDAYDASGVAGLTVKAGDSERQFNTLRLAPAKAPVAEWLEVRARDHAGNLAPEIMIPIRPGI